MTDEELIKEIKRLFGSKRITLLKALHECADKIPVQAMIEQELQKTTGLHVKSCVALSDDTLKWMSQKSSDIKKLNFDPEDRSELIGDPSFWFLLLLNKNIKDPLDFDEKLAERHNTLFFCEIWASILFPLYTYDIYYWKYSKKDNIQEFGPYKPQKKHEAIAVNDMKKAMKTFGYKLISKKTAKTIIRQAITDCAEKGEATVFDCIFSDMTFYTETKSRMNIERNVYPELGMECNWREYYDKKHKLYEKKIYMQFYERDDETIVIDSEGRIKKFEIGSGSHANIPSQWITYDTDKKTGYLTRKKEKHKG